MLRSLRLGPHATEAPWCVLRRFGKVQTWVLGPVLMHKHETTHSPGLCGPLIMADSGCGSTWSWSGGADIPSPLGMQEATLLSLAVAPGSPQVQGQRCSDGGKCGPGQSPGREGWSGPGLPLCPL